MTPEARRGLLRAFTDRMLLKITAMDDPEDMPSVERAVRVAAVIECIYSRCDRAAPDPFQQQAERARQESEAIKARVALANTLEWGEKRRRDLGPWWDAAQNATQNAAALPTPQPASAGTPAPAGASALKRSRAEVDNIDYTGAILKARADLGLTAPSAKKPPPPA
ncbi:hypothetical protein ABENE_16630 [Asticcacaulis benevestitus DSM 16100 = ATCC BAA-896]|uniref:Uncharacterized protein n=1 Tax=Asticcacaulis benevestitus DSM 16100 = ATCC BAA-896 TaxID=1121022 RepID=V4PI44_9CAUL|nr:hypothetical protein ABENE_16630 [Asticcacaulis benevestitus DSM 16100 = ATCC BAA-896]